ILSQSPQEHQHLHRLSVKSSNILKNMRKRIRMILDQQSLKIKSCQKSGIRNRLKEWNKKMSLRGSFFYEKGFVDDCVAFTLISNCSSIKIFSPSAITCSIYCPVSMMFLPASFASYAS